MTNHINSDQTTHNCVCPDIAQRWSRAKGTDELVSFPITEMPTTVSGRHSVSIGKRNGTPDPAYPGSAEFKAQMDEFISVRESVRLGLWPKPFLSTGNPAFTDGSVPEYFDEVGVYEDEPETAGHLVAMDDATDVGIHIFKVLQKEGVPPKVQYNHVPFVEEYARFLKTIGNNVYEALVAAFETKDYFGLERPETVLELPGCVITDSDNGCPPHMSFVAGHGAVFGATYQTILQFFDFTNHEAERLKALDALWQGAMYRTLLGVHYRQDNEQGFLLGIRVVNGEL